MMTTVKRSLKDSDAVLVLIDLTVDHKEQLAMLAPPPDAPPTALVLNKIDTVPVRTVDCCLVYDGRVNGRFDWDIEERIRITSVSGRERWREVAEDVDVRRWRH